MLPQSPIVSKILFILEDGLWHSISEVVEKIGVDPAKLEQLFSWMLEDGFLERQGENVKLVSMLVNIP